ncbi:peptidyl-tRNA hydrolase isoform X2 [Phascolarctos cinereus]|uniref:peptidyl-tRNA hydrolase n=1 Tax=Phascolarctos cinereus TaxID=38626 RepID=A0A6P5IQB1_PHACI|nr:probable peptidyl-tRNA hydrolase isoform X2 [Phascolarctos cinereus]
MNRSGLGLLWSRLSRGMSRAGPEPRPPGKRWLVAGLGNYRLQGTRHSVGMAVLNQLAKHLNVADQWKRQRQCCADVAIARLGEAELMYQLAAEDIYLVHDELDKPLGKLAMKLGGSASGHNGVRSCINCLNSNVMPRLRVGIGRPTHPGAVEQYVLDRFTAAEQERLPPLLEQATEVLLSHIRQRSLAGTACTSPS